MSKFDDEVKTARSFMRAILCSPQKSTPHEVALAKYARQLEITMENIAATLRIEAERIFAPAARKLSKTTEFC